MKKVMLPYCVYVLLSDKDYQLYIGYTTNLERRFSEHKEGKVKSTSRRRPMRLVFCEYYLHKEDAQRRELYFKTTAGKKTLKLMLRKSFEQLNYKHLK